MNFASDNWAGAAPDIAAAIAEEASRIAPSYGGDVLSHEVETRFATLFEHEVAVFFAATGTASNALALSAFARPGGLAFCHANAHVNTDEAGAAEFLADIKLIGLPGGGAKIDPAALRQAIERHPPAPNRHGRAVAVSLSQLTEFGTAYTPAEATALAGIAHKAGLGVHVDGARFANAVVATGASPAELTWKAGVDVLSFGGTKGGCWQAEAVVLFDPARAAEFQYLRKRSGHVLSKNRFVAAQFKAFLDGNRWLELATHANAMARRLASGLVAMGGRTAWPAEGNELFAVLPASAVKRLRNAGATFHEWDAGDMTGGHPSDGEVLVRLVASWATSTSEVDHFIAVAAE